MHRVDLEALAKAIKDCFYVTLAIAGRITKLRILSPGPLDIIKMLKMHVISVAVPEFIDRHLLTCCSLQPDLHSFSTLLAPNETP